MLMAVCDLLNTYSPADIGRALMTYSRDENADKFIDRFINKQGIPKTTRYKLDSLDSEDAIQKSIQGFNKSMDDAIAALTSRKPDLLPKFNELKSKVLETLHVDLDEHSSGSTPEGDSSIETKTTFEMLDNNQLSLDEHLKEIYGTGAYNIIRQLKEGFKDNLFAACYYNVANGAIVIQLDSILNQNLINLKNKYFKQIVEYLKSVDSKYEKLPNEFVDEDGFIGGKYFYVMQAFYDHIKHIPDLQQTLDNLSSKKLNNYDKISNTETYTQVVNTLLQNSDFNKTYRSGKQQDNVKNTLYTADHLSSYFYEVKRLLNNKKYQDLLNTKIDGKTVKDILDSFELENNDLLSATNAYTSLIHFDEMLVDSLGDSIDIKQGQKGIEFGDPTKYSYEQDTTNQKKGWQTSESVKSEKYVAKITDAFLNQIRVLSYKTDQFQNRRLNSTSVIVAARNLIDDILYNKLDLFQWSRNNDNRKQAINDFALALADLHDNPQNQLYKALSLLFEPVKGSSQRLIDTIPLNNTTATTEYDLNILYSLYETALNESNPNSLRSQELKNIKQINGPVSQLSAEISGIIARNTTIHYLETSFDGETGMVQIKVKKRYFNNADTYKTRVRINRNINNSSNSERKARRNKWQFDSINDVDGRKQYSVVIGDERVTYISDQILNSDGKYQNSDLFNDLNRIDLTSFRQKLLRNEELTERERKLKDLLSFIDDHLGLKILENPSQKIQQLEIFQQLNKDNLKDLTTLAIKAAYVNYLYDEAGNQDFAEYLSNTGKDGIYRIYENNKKSKLFTNMFNNLKITVASFKDSVLEAWSDAYSMQSGEASKSTTKNKAGDNIPNNSVNKLGTNIHHYLFKQKDTNAGSLFFVQDSTKIRGIQHDLEATSQWQESKQLKNFSQGELFFHSVFNKFWGSYLQYGTFIIQPTAYSDKTTFINYEITKNLFGDDIIKDENLGNTIVKYTIDTIGTFYKNVWNSTKSKLQRITDEYNRLETIKNNGVPVNYTYQQMLSRLTEPELIKLANSIGENVTLDADYRKAGKHLAVNELLQYYAEELYANPDVLNSFLNQQKHLFIQNFLDNNCTYQVVNLNDSVDNYYGEKLPESISNNPIMQTILGLYKNDSKGRSEFFKNWVDAKTGKLILAKQNGLNIISNTKIDSSKNIVLNPLLDKFFYVEGFLSNNLRMSLTGSEINHPDKAKQTIYNLVKSCNNSVDFFTKTKMQVDEDTFQQAKEFLNTTNSVADLKYTTIPANISSFIDDVYHQSITMIANVAQGTQFKRNVIIPATLQYCQPKVINGISAKTKCAVIRDEKAPVYDYRGDHEDDIDSADGSAQINPFQSILENKALGSQAVGFIKKPIWHAYDPVTGTAFLAKFATDTITNETMRASLNSHTSLFRMFKKMTNLQWKGDVDLMQSIALGNLDESKILATARWFNNVILGNADGVKSNQLYYKDKYGDQIQITGFNKTITKGNTLYYTTEAPVIKGIEAPSHKVYHVFYDSPNQKSNHATFDTWQQAQAFLMDQSNPEMTNKHTINSLFELHTALGGINCVDSKGNYSEFSNEVVVNFMNAVGHKINESADNVPLDQDNYMQPLKQYHIGYALNNTAVKNGAQNINQYSAWYDDKDLSYFEVDSDGLGMQMNADHDIIDSELTEFSQVVTATSAYGFTYDNTDEIFQGLGRASLATTKKMSEAVDTFIQNFEDPKQAQADLYDSIGRIVMKSSSIKDRESLQHVIMQAVESVFYKSKNHQQDNSKIPFSDPNIYSDFIATLASTINKEAIKRKHPGSGCVMVPAYHMIQYFEFGGEKLMATDILKRAQEDYKQSLITLLQSHKDYTPQTNSIGEFFINGQSTKQLEDQVQKLKIENPDRIDTQDITSYNHQLIQRYLNKKQQEVEVRPDKSWFMPSDNVNIIDSEGKIHTVELNSMDDYYKFKDGINDIEIANNVSIKVDYKKGTYKITSPTAELNLTKINGKWVADSSELSAIATQLVGEVMLPSGDVVTGEKQQYNFKYQENIVRPHDLRPSLLRWQDSETGEYMNIFDSPVIRNAYTNPESKKANHQSLIQAELNNIHNGTYTDRFGNEKTIMQGSLQNYAAELVMSNIYKDKFGIENESLAEVLKQGEDYFYKKFNRVNAPANTSYDFAFVKDTGNTTLITLTPVKNNDYIQYKGFEASQLSTNDKEEIQLTRGNRDLFEVGKWINAPEVTYRDGEFINTDGIVLDPNQYRLRDLDDHTSVQRRVDYVKQYVETTKQIVKGRVVHRTNTLYEIAPLSDFKIALGNEADAAKQRASIIAKIYRADNYKLAQINNFKVYSKDAFNHIKSASSYFLGNQLINQDVKDLLQAQLDSITTTNQQKSKDELVALSKENKATYKELLEAFLRKEAHKRYVSFLDSQNFIAARIPAQSLQSFMTMRNIAWTENSKNISYVSHFQTYLQGSDYDIDKAYIMGQSYDENAAYIGWSPLFNYNNVEALQASKTLPIPKHIVVYKGDYDISNEINTLINLAENQDVNEVLQNVHELGNAAFIKQLSKIIRIAEQHNGINYSGDAKVLNTLIETINKHENYLISDNVAESAFKNVASANIYQVSHDIRNRDQAYTAIAMGIMRKAADNSPKGNQAATLNMLNPMTKYIMQYQNLVGKNVISVAANGEKVWFNTFYYWTKVLKSGNQEAINKLKFQHTYKRINGRAKGTPIEQTINHIPDLNKYDEQIKSTLQSQFGVLDNEDYKYVDQLISQLLSAATDNAKELILAKINAGTNFARMYVYGMMMGLNINDLVAFMTSPVSELIDQLANPNMFQNEKGNAAMAINLAQGIVGVNKFLHGQIKTAQEDINTGEQQEVWINKNKYVTNYLKNSDIYNLVKQNAGLSEEEDINGLGSIMQAYINYAITNQDVDLTELIDTNDVEVNSYLRYCQDLTDKLRRVRAQYKKDSDFRGDIEEFKNLYNDASEISTISSAWLGLNQGLPTSELDLLSRMNRMSKIVHDREKALNMNVSKIYPKEGAKEKEIQEAEQAKEQLINRLHENNPTLDPEYIANELDIAHEQDLINNFDIYKYLVDDEYRKQASDYYDIIKSTVNVFEMMEQIPHYKQILQLFKSLVVANNTFASKSRLVNKLLANSENVDDKQLNGVLKYVDKLNTLSFMRTLTPITVNQVDGFDPYFQSIKVNKIDPSTINGVATLKHWVEHEFLNYLRENYSNNSLVRHLTLVPYNNTEVLATDIDLLNPDITIQSREAYDDILRGMADFETRQYQGDYTIADILQMYNIAVNNNQYGGERLTTSFKVCTNPKNILNRYLKFISDQDWDIETDQEYNYTDYLIAAAPVISTYAESYHQEPFVKVNDPVQGYVLKKLDNNNQYQEYDLIPPPVADESYQSKMNRLQNFSENSPLEMPNMHNILFLTKTIDFDGKFDELDADEQKQTIDGIRNLLTQYITSNKASLIKDC